MSYTDIKSKIDSVRNEIILHGKLSSEQLNKINNKFRLEWNFNSNSMEGNTLTIEETRSVMVGNLDVREKPIKDVLEMKGHDEVISSILKIGKGEFRLSEKRIKEIHAAIMHEENPEQRHKIGQWKTQANEIINSKGEKYLFTAPELVPDRIHDLLNRTNAAIDLIESGNKRAQHPIDIALQFHLEYLEIHPFYDGNGRTARILTNLILIGLGFTPFWISKPERSAYYHYISDIQGYGGKKEKFFEFISNLILRSEQLVLDVLEGRDIHEEDDLQKEIELLKRQLKGEKFTKSPTMVYDTFKLVDREIWTPIFVFLKQFDELFDEDKLFHSVNNMEEVFPTKSLLPVIPNFLEKSTKPPEKKVFGHDVYEEDVDVIEWKSVKYGLKKSKSEIRQEVALRVSFDQTGYKWALWVHESIFFEMEADYQASIDESIVLDLKKRLGRKLLDDIRRAITN